MKLHKRENLAYFMNQIFYINIRIPQLVLSFFQFYLDLESLHFDQIIGLIP